MDETKPAPAVSEPAASQPNLAATDEMDIRAFRQWRDQRRAVDQTRNGRIRLDKEAEEIVQFARRWSPFGEPQPTKSSSSSECRRPDSHSDSRRSSTEALIGSPRCHPAGDPTSGEECSGTLVLSDTLSIGDTLVDCACMAAARRVCEDCRPRAMRAQSTSSSTTVPMLCRSSISTNRSAREEVWRTCTPRGWPFRTCCCPGRGIKLSALCQRSSAWRGRRRTRRKGDSGRPVGGRPTHNRSKRWPRLAGRERALGGSGAATAELAVDVSRSGHGGSSNF